MFVPKSQLNLKVRSLRQFSRVASPSEVTDSSQPLLSCFPFCFFLSQGKRKWTFMDLFILRRHKFFSVSRREEDTETAGWMHISLPSPGSQTSRAEGTSGGHQAQRPCPSRDTFLQQAAQEALEDLQGGRLHNLSEQPVPVLCHLYSEQVLRDVQMEPLVFQFVPFVLIFSQTPSMSRCTSQVTWIGPTVVGQVNEGQAGFWPAAYLEQYWKMWKLTLTRTSFLLDYTFTTKQICYLTPTLFLF